MSCARVVSRFEVISADEAGRRRSWSDEEKIRIVEESHRGHRQGSAVARRYGISRWLLTQWRKAYRLGLLGGAPAAFAPLEIAPDPMPRVESTAGGEAHERIEVTLGNGRRLSVAPSIDGSTLARFIQVLEQA